MAKALPCSSTWSSFLTNTIVRKSSTSYFRVGPIRSPCQFVFGARVRARAQAEAEAQAEARPTWLPGLDPPPYLDGSLAGDFGFDPLGLGEDPGSLKWFVQAELIHARFAMAGVAGILFTDLLRTTGISKLPLWYEAGATKFDFASTRSLLFVQLLLMGFVEMKRYMDFINPGSQAADGSFFGIEPSLQGQQPGYPGGPLFNPLGLAKDIKNAHDWKLKEIKNGRLAMIAMLGIFVQASVTHKGPIENLVDHLSDPFHKTIIQMMSTSNSL